LNAFSPGRAVILVATRPDHKASVRTDIVVVRGGGPIQSRARGREARRRANMVALGAFLGASGLVSPDLVRDVLAETFSGRQKDRATEPGVPVEGLRDRAGLRAGDGRALTAEIASCKETDEGWRKPSAKRPSRAGAGCFFGLSHHPAERDSGIHVGPAAARSGACSSRPRARFAASNMLYGAAGAGCRCFTSSSSPASR